MSLHFKYLIAILLPMWPIWVNAQNQGLYNSNLSETSNRLEGKLTGEIYYFEITENSNYFLHQNWVNGSITLKNGEIFENQKIRYHAYLDELIVYNSANKVLVKADKNTISEFKVYEPEPDGSVAVKTFINFDLADVNKGFCEQLYSGSIQLLVFYRIIEKKVDAYIDENGIGRDNEFVMKETTCIYSKEKGLRAMKLKNSSFFAIYPEHEKEIRKIFRENKIKISDKTSAIQAVGLIDEARLLK